MCSGGMNFSYVPQKSTWTEKFQMYKLEFKKTKEPEIKLSTAIG